MSNRFISEENGPADWQKPKHIREAIAERSKRLRASRAFCPTGPGGGVDNSCSSKDGGGGGSSSSGGGGGKRASGNKEFKEFVAWRATSSEKLAAVRSRIEARAKEVAKTIKAEQKEIERLDKWGDMIDDQRDKLKLERFKARESLQAALMSHGIASGEGAKKWATTPKELLTIKLEAEGIDRFPENIRAAFQKVKEAEDESQYASGEYHKVQKEISDKREAMHSLQVEAARQAWKDIGDYGRQYATTVSEQTPSYSREAHDQAAEKFRDRLSGIAVITDGATGPSLEKRFTEGAKQEVQVFLSAAVDPASTAAIAIAGSHIALQAENTRAYCTGSKVVASPHCSASTYAHELGHVIENSSPDILEAAIAFREHRCKDSDDIKMSDAIPTGGYSSEEVGNRDNFSKVSYGVYADSISFRDPDANAYYTGKVYRDFNKIRATEIVSVGMQMLHDSPAAFAREDPEYFDFMVGIVTGSHHSYRKKMETVSLPTGPIDGDGDGIVNEEDKR